jgi:hypothetical protein
MVLYNKHDATHQMFQTQNVFRMIPYDAVDFTNVICNCQHSLCTEYPPLYLQLVKQFVELKSLTETLVQNLVGTILMGNIVILPAVEVLTLLLLLLTSMIM